MESFTSYIYLIPAFISPFLAIVAIFTILPHVQRKIESKNGKKPKAYFQFWASQFFILGLGIWTLVHNAHVQPTDDDDDDLPLVGILLSMSLPGILIVTISPVFFTDMNTPTQCCCCCRGFFRIFVTYLAMVTTTFFFLVFIASIPSIIFIYYLYPVQTLVRLPFVINSVLYINSLGALLLYQLERCFYPCTPRSVMHGKEISGCCNRCKSPLREERLKAHHEYYRKYYNENKCAPLLCHLQPLATAIVLVILILFIVILSDLLSMDRTKFTEKNEVEMLLTLVPTVALLFGSIYNKDFFFKDLDMLGEDEELKRGNTKEPTAKEPNESTRLLINGEA